MRDRLREFYSKNGISAADFACPSQVRCQSAVKAAGGTFTPAREVAIGEQYLVARPRIVVVSLDPGSQFYPDKGRFAGPEELQMQIREAASQEERWHQGRHWYRTHAAVAVVVKAVTGLDITPYEAAAWFAHTSVVRCCANLPRAGQAPGQMYWNCRSYLEDELAILKPDIIWSQGSQTLDAMSWIARFLPKDAPGAFAVVRNVACPWGTVTWIQTDHPSARGGDWDKTLALMQTVTL